MNSKKLLVLSLSLLVAIAACGKKDDAPKKDDPVKKDDPGKKVDKEPGADKTPAASKAMPNRVFWGDTHLHTRNSPDAGFLGNTLSPEDAYRFAMGEMVKSSTGLDAKLKRPLDFLVVADHAEYFGIVSLLINGDKALLADPIGKRWYETYKASKGGGDAIYQEIIQGSIAKQPKELISNKDATKSIWMQVNETAEKYNKPGEFTALIGFEWSSIISGNNMHRVVILRDSAERANKIVPLSMFESNDPEYLWKWMEGYEKSTGGQVLAIPHNGNWSNGMMFAREAVDGRPLDRAYAETRMRWEPIYEVTQMKGDGETHPVLSTNDEFADFEPWDKANVPANVAKTDAMLPFEYARSALRNGLALESSLGANPFKFGMIGATDSHTALATSREDNFFGKLPHMEPSDHRATVPLIKSPLGDKYTQFGSETGAAGLAGVWAPENTREALWDGMKRKEVYATTGSRITVRNFAGWDFKAEDVKRDDFAEHGYATGVPMGGDLSKAPEGKSPSFVIQAQRDPDNANLDRVQVIKGWLDKDGKTHERIYDVAVSGDRKIGDDGRCKTPVGNTVNIPDASYTNTIGAPALSAHWTDPEFDATQAAFYYVRVIEIPKPRWTAYDAKRFKVKMPKGTVMQVQDRAYTSPIWYTPAK